MNKTKIKEWIKEHKKELIIGSISVAVGAVGGVTLYKFSRKSEEKINAGAISLFKILLPATIGSKSCTYTDFAGNGEWNMTLKDCPKLVEELVGDERFDPDQGITGMAVFFKEEAK